MTTLTGDELTETRGGAGDDPQTPWVMKQLTGTINQLATTKPNTGTMFGGPLVGFVSGTAAPSSTK